MFICRVACYELLRMAYECEQLQLEPSTCAGLAGVCYCADVDNAVHVAWATGGSIMPFDVFEECLVK